MRLYTLSRLSFLVFTMLFIFSCEKKTGQIDDYDFQPERLTELFLLQSGKYITYRLDSTVFPNFGRTTEIHNYQVKHLVDAQTTDNLGRPSHRVFRYLRDSSGTQPWVPNGSYFITVTTDQVEVIEDNLRVIKIHVPVRDANSWKGNKHLPDDPYDHINRFNSYDDGMEDWDFFFVGPKTNEMIGNKTVNDVYTIQHIDESFNFPVTDPKIFAARTLSVEKYAKNIGLVYREYILWENQPNLTGTPPNVTYDPYKLGFGIKMWMIDHN